MINFKKIDNKTILVTGATGLVGKTFIEHILNRNKEENVSTKIIAIGRNKQKMLSTFSDYCDDDNISFIEHDVKEQFNIEQELDYIIHLASNTHPRLYASEPIDTVLANILGTHNLLELASKKKKCIFFLMSSGDIYGDTIGDKKYLSENDCGYINCNTLRAGYIEGKRASEALCNAYYEEKGVKFFIGRLCRIFGPNMRITDSKAISQFVVNAVNGKNIILKSSGEQIYSYLSADDAILAMLYILCNGEYGEAYNISDNTQVMKLKDLAKLIAEIGNIKVLFGESDELETKGSGNFNRICLDSTKINALGWKPSLSLEEGLKDTIFKLKQLQKVNL